MSGKRKESDREVHGAPDIVHPDDQEKWETQSAFVLAWLFEMLDRVECDDKKAAREARAELKTFFLNLSGQLLRIALSKKNSAANRWSGPVLADIFISIGKHVGKVRVTKPYGKLLEQNATFRTEMKKIGKVRTDILFPTLVRAIAQRELKTAARHRRTLLFLEAGCVSEREQKRRGKLAKEHGFELADRERGTTRKQAAERQKIPQPYWPLMKFPEFYPRSFGRWFKFLWPLISKKIDTVQMESRYELARKRYPADSQKTVRDYLMKLAKLRKKGTYYFF